MVRCILSQLTPFSLDLLKKTQSSTFFAVKKATAFGLHNSTAKNIELLGLYPIRNPRQRHLSVIAA